MHNLLICHIEFRTDESEDVVPYTFKRSLETVVIPIGDKLQQIREDYVDKVCMKCNGVSFKLILLKSWIGLNNYITWNNIFIKCIYISHNMSDICNCRKVNIIVQLHTFSNSSQHVC